MKRNSLERLDNIAGIFSSYFHIIKCIDILKFWWGFKVFTYYNSVDFCLLGGFKHLLKGDFKDTVSTFLAPSSQLEHDNIV